MRLRGVVAVAVLTVAPLVATALSAQAATGTAVRAGRVTGSGLGFDSASAPSTAVLRAWTVSPYRSVNVYFSGTQRYDTTQAQLSADWVTTVLSNGWSLIPTVVDLQAPAPCYGGKKQKMSPVPSTAAVQGTQAAQTAHNDLVNYGIGGTVAYLDLEPFDVSKSSACAPAVLAFVHAWVKQLHATGEKAGVYVHWQRGAPTIVNDYASTYRPDDIWVAQYDGVANPATAVIGTKWPHHRIHQYLGNSTETYGDEKVNIDRDAIDADVVRATSVTTPSGPPYTYYVSGTPNGLAVRTQPNTSQPPVTTLPNNTPVQIACQATGQTVDGDYVWDKLVDGTYVSDIYTTTTGRNWVSPAIAKCDTTPPTVALRPLSFGYAATAVTIGWAAVDGADPTGTPPGETRGISSSTMRYRFASWHGGFGAWHTRTTTAQSSKLAVSAGYTYCVQVRAADLSGNLSPWTPSTCFARALDDRALSAGSGWTRGTGSQFYFHTYTNVRATGRTLLRTNASLARVGVVATTCVKCGPVRVYVGSHYVGTVNLQAAATHYRQVFMLPPFTLRSATVRLTTTSSRLVQIDGVVISRT